VVAEALTPLELAVLVAQAEAVQEATQAQQVQQEQQTQVAQVEAAVTLVLLVETAALASLSCLTLAHNVQLAERSLATLLVGLRLLFTPLPHQAHLQHKE
jgi:hypothetical protein